MFEEFAQDAWQVTPKLHIDYCVRVSTTTGFYPLWANADYFNGALYNPAQAVTVNAQGNVVLGTGNPYNGIVILGYSSFPSSANGRVAAATQPLCDTGGPNLNPTSGTFGEVTGKSNLARTMQLSLRYSF